MKKLKMFQKKHLFPLLFCVIFLLSANYSFAARPLVGVIRYNQFAVPNDSDLYTLSPAKWHDRIPWFLDVTTDVVSGTFDQTEFNQDMQYAVRGGIDYFAHLETGPNSKPVTYHMASPYKDQLKFAIIIHLAHLRSDSFVDNWSTTIVNYFKDPSYQKVMNGRPLLFILNWDQRIIDHINSKAQAAGIAAPYIFGGYTNYMYTATGLTSYQGYLFAETMNRNIQYWESFSYKNKRIPNVTIGNDQRPRWERPPSWGTFSNPWFEQPTTSEITYLVGKALDWVVENNTEVNSIIIYAWDEVAEGGWLVPTHSEGDARVKALGDFLAQYNNGTTNPVAPSPPPTSDTTPPTVPANLSVTAASLSQINLTWAASIDNVGVTGYKIYRNGTQIATVTGNAYSNTGLSAGTSYSYQVSAHDTAGNESAKSSSVSATTSISNPQTGNVVIRAKGTPAANVWPQMDVWINGSKIGNVSVNTTAYADFYFNHSGSVQTLDVVFTNDASDSATGQDRNLYIDYAIVNGTKIEAEASGVIIDKGSGTAAFDGINTIPGQEGIYWNAALRSTVSTPDTTSPAAPSGLKVN